MLFNSAEFAIFLPIVFLLYWFVFKRLRQQNILLLAASYFFYGCWDYRFLFLLVFSTLLDYYTGLKMHGAKTHKEKTFWFWLSIGINLGFLGVFKYYNFFIDSLTASMSWVGIQTNFWTLNVVLPVGISFYTFHGLSYVIDIYKGKIEPEKNFVDYSVFVSFFPLLVAGPIERATHLLPQIVKEREFDYNQATDGLRQMLWGFFKKIVIADNCAPYVNDIFVNHEIYSGSTLLLGAIFFTIQLYCDFSGYSDIAIGTARLFGISLLQNFDFPFFSRDMPELWRRWHISLTSWFQDYVYFPLGGSRLGKAKQVRNIFIVFFLSGLWHGADWSFIIWGLVFAMYLLPSMLWTKKVVRTKVVAEGKTLPTPLEFYQMLQTFMLVVMVTILFRAKHISDAFHFIGGIFSKSFFNIPEVFPETIVFLILFMLALEWRQREKKHGLQFDNVNIPSYLRWTVYYVIMLTIILLGGSQQEFIYFQF